MREGEGEGLATDAAMASKRPESLLVSLFDGGSGGPSYRVVAHLGRVRSEGHAFNRGVKGCRFNIPTVLKAHMGQVFAELSNEVYVD